METNEESRSKSRSHCIKDKTPKDLKKIKLSRSPIKSHRSTISTKNGTTYKISMETTNRPKSLITESKVINLDLPESAPETKTLVALVKAKFSNNLTVEVQGVLFKNYFEFLNLPYMIVDTKFLFKKLKFCWAQKLIFRQNFNINRLFFSEIIEEFRCHLQNSE